MSEVYPYWKWKRLPWYTRFIVRVFGERCDCYKTICYIYKGRLYIFGDKKED